MDLRWDWRRFPALDADGVYDMLALRARVFVLEQGPYLDPDGADRSAWHLLGRNTAGELVAYLRVVDPGVKFDEPSLGRVVVAGELRSRGVGHELVREGLARCDAVWPGRANRISAQAHLQRFYRRHGFETVTPEYLEDDIPHVQMLRSSR
jgi:ElaA protein